MDRALVFVFVMLVFATHANATSPSNGDCWTTTAGYFCRINGTIVDLASGRGLVSVLNYGADSSGATDSTSAFSAALTAGKGLYIPCGTYKLNLTISVSSFSIVGSGACTILKPNNTGQPVITVSGSNFSVLANLWFAGAGSTSDGLKMVSATSNLRVDHVIFDGFGSGAGINCAMVSGAESSGLLIHGGYTLNNNYGYKLTECQDARITDAQVGRNTTAGILLDHSEAGHITGSFIWENGRAIDATDAHFMRIENNRLTQSLLEALRYQASDSVIVNDNEVNQSSTTTPGAVPDIALTGIANSVFTGNNFHDWSGIAHSDYAITADATSTNLNITGNAFSAFNTVAATNISTSAPKVTLAHNTPFGTNSANWFPVANVTLSTPFAGVGGTISTVYLSPISAASAQAVLSPAAGLIGCFNISTSVTPARDETWTYTVQKNGSNSTLTATQTAGSFSAHVCDRTSAASVGLSDHLSLKVTTSGATNLGGVNFRGAIVIYE
jgi:hypothetical protein